MPKKRTGLDTIMASATETGGNKPAVSTRRAGKAAPVAKVEVSASSNELPKTGADRARHMVYIAPEVDQQLRDMLHEDNRGARQRKKMNDYYLEALDLLFKLRGLKSIAELTKEE